MENRLICRWSASYLSGSGREATSLSGPDYGSLFSMVEYHREIGLLDQMRISIDGTIGYHHVQQLRGLGLRLQSDD